MPVKVIDASALAAVLFGEPEGESVVGRAKGAGLVAPALLRFELTNVCLMKMRRYPADREKLISAFKLLAHMEIQTIDVDHPGVLELAEKTGLTAYDASYLWLAHRLAADLVTLDRKLEAALATSSRN
jgi:predicted nucleic acid-binding protein